MKMPCSKLVEIGAGTSGKIEDIKGDQKDIGWGNQIRSLCVYAPYVVKDHRTGFEMAISVPWMDGLDGFINAHLKLAEAAESRQLQNDRAFFMRVVVKVGTSTLAHAIGRGLTSGGRTTVPVLSDLKMQDIR